MRQNAAFSRLFALMFVSSFGACAAPKNVSQPAIINGVDSATPAVVPVLRTDGSGYCTAGLLNSMLAVTARHCIEPSLPGCGVTIDGHSPGACFEDPDWIANDASAGNAQHDMVVLAFHKADDVPWPAGHVNDLLKFGPSSNPARLIGAEVRMIGFGRTDWQGHAEEQTQIGSGQGVGIGANATTIPAQHACSNVISAVEQDASGVRIGIVHFSAEDRRTSACLPSFGDSGGPLLARDPSNGRDYIVGIASSVYYPSLGVQDAVYVALYTDVAIDILSRALDWADQDAGVDP